MRRSIRSPKLILALLTGLNLFNYLDRYVLSAVVTPLQIELHLSNFVAGLLPSVFLIGYFVTSPIFGAMGDRYSGRDKKASTRARNSLLAAGIGVWSAATLGSGLARGATSMIASRAMVGVGEASYATLAPALIDDLAPTTRKSAWMAIFCAATPIGSALGYLVGGAALHAHGWRSAFYVAGAPGLLAALLCLLIAPDSTQRVQGPGPRAARAAATLAQIGLYRNAVLGYCAYTFAIGGLAYWAPKYLHDRYSLDAARASVEFGTLTVVGGAVGTLLGGFLADRAVRAERRRHPRTIGPPAGTNERDTDDAVARANIVVCAGACAAGAPLALAAICAPSAAGFFALALPCQVALFVLSGPVNVALLRSAPPALRASAMAVCIFAIHAFGDLWSNPLIGLMADHGPMQLAMYAVPAAFAVAAFVWWRTARVSARLT